jgi:hypothetical protein
MPSRSSLACRVYPLSASFKFGEIAKGDTLVSKVVVPLLDFDVVKPGREDDPQFLAKVELDAERIVGSYGPRERDPALNFCPSELCFQAG